ncbi:MAG TPA: hypothetical protein DDZ51_20375, partial [Planctomycetaceae bacterium]|nr:hypothetical protein [Planctomycetaceae bacterium]
DANLYRYVENRPTTLTDPSGLFKSGVHGEITEQTLAVFGIDPRSTLGALIVESNIKTDFAKELLTEQLHAQAAGFPEKLRQLMQNIKSAKCETVRDRRLKAIQIGLALHLIQDFFSHTDWIDGKNLVPNYAWWRQNHGIFGDKGEALLMHEGINHNPHNNTFSLTQIYEGDFSEIDGVLMFQGGYDPTGLPSSQHNRFAADSDGFGRDNPRHGGNANAFENAKRLALSQSIEFMAWVRQNAGCGVFP